MRRVYARLIIIGIALIGMAIGVYIVPLLSEEQIYTVVYAVGYSAVGLSALALFLVILFVLGKEP